MDLNNLNNIIEEITKEVMRRLAEKDGLPDLPQLLIPLSYNPVTWEESCAGVREISACHDFKTLLLADGRDLDMVEKQFEKTSVEFFICNQVNKISPEVFLNVKILLVPLFSPYNLGRVANLTPLLLVEWIVLEAIQRGIKILIVKDGFYPGSIYRKSAGLDKGPSPFNDLIKNYTDRLSSYGIKFIDLSSVKQSVESEFQINEKTSVFEERKGKAVITKEDILAFSASGNKIIEVSHGSIITPLAKDIAREKNIEIRFKV